MTRTASIRIFAGLALVPFALGVAACGSDDDNSSSSPQTSSAASTAAGQSSSGSTSGTVDVASTDLGNVLIDSKGFTLYLFDKDSGTTSECTGACATAWPPLRSSGQPTVGSGADASMLGTTPRSDGDPQVTYNGHPLYLYIGDTKAGDTSGEGVNAFGAAWYTMSAAGDAVTSAASGSDTGSSNTSSSSNSGGGNGY